MFGRIANLLNARHRAFCDRFTVAHHLLRDASPSISIAQNQQTKAVLSVHHFYLDITLEFFTALFLRRGKDKPLLGSVSLSAIPPVVAAELFSRTLPGFVMGSLISERLQPYAESILSGLSDVHSFGTKAWFDSQIPLLSAQSFRRKEVVIAGKEGDFQHIENVIIETLGRFIQIPSANSLMSNEFQISIFIGSAMGMAMEHVSEQIIKAGSEDPNLIVQCPECPQRIRIPKNRGRIRITCPACKNIWERLT